MTTINISSGMAQYVGGTVTEVTGKDISGATFQIGFTSSNALPVVWISPDVSTIGSSTAQRILKVLVSATAPATSPLTSGVTYTCYAKIADNPEILPIQLQNFTTG